MQLDRAINASASACGWEGSSLKEIPNSLALCGTEGVRSPRGLGGGPFLWKQQQRWPTGVREVQGLKGFTKQKDEDLNFKNHLK